MAPSFDFFPFPPGEGRFSKASPLRCFFCKLSTWQDRRAAARPRRECAVTSIFARGKNLGGGAIDCAAVDGFAALRMRRTPCGCLPRSKMKSQGSHKSVSFCGKNGFGSLFFFLRGRKKKSAPGHRRKKVPLVQTQGTRASIERQQRGAIVLPVEYRADTLPFSFRCRSRGAEKISPAGNKMWKNLAFSGDTRWKMTIFSFEKRKNIHNSRFSVETFRNIFILRPAPAAAVGVAARCLFCTKLAALLLCAQQRGIGARFCPSLHQKFSFSLHRARRVSFSLVRKRKRNGGRNRSSHKS